MRRHGVHSLLMGGQACVFYGAAEFSRDVDFAVLADPDNIARISAALGELEANVIAVPQFDPSYLLRGLAVHFRCEAPGAEGMRVDLMTVMRGVDPFDCLWERRTTIEVDGTVADLMSLPDLVKAKKTQRPKDWPMIQRLMEAHWFQNRNHPNPERVTFWLGECRTPTILIELASRFPEQASALQTLRPLLAHALGGDINRLESGLDMEREAEVAADRAYWKPLREELERLRRMR